MRTRWNAWSNGVPRQTRFAPRSVAASRFQPSSDGTGSVGISHSKAPGAGTPLRPSKVKWMQVEKRGEGETIRVSDEPNVDIAPDGTVYGVELLNANEQLRGGDAGTLVVINEALGPRQ